MNKILTILLCILLISNFADAQNWVWADKVGLTGGGNDYGMDNEISKSGNLYVTGRVKSASIFGKGIYAVSPPFYGDRDVFIAKYDTVGNLMWAKRSGGPTSDYGYGLACTADEGVCVTGYFSDTATFSDTILKSKGVQDFYLARYDRFGNLLWSRAAGGLGSTINGQDIIVQDSSYIYVAGWFNGSVDFGTTVLTSFGNTDGFIAKYDLQGNFIWAKNYGNTSQDNLYDIALDKYGYVYVTGEFATTLVNGVTVAFKGARDMFLVKLDPLGNISWIKTGGSTGQDAGKSLSINNNKIVLGGYIAASATFNTTIIPSAGGRDIFIGEYDLSGNLLWVKSYGTSLTDEAWGVKIDSLNEVYAIGVFSDTITFDSFSLPLLGDEDIFITKFDSLGNAKWVKQVQGNTVAGIIAHGYSLDVDKDLSVYPTGGFLLTIPFDTITLTAAGTGSDVFMGKINQELFCRVNLTDSGYCQFDTITISPILSSSVKFIFGNSPGAAYTNITLNNIKLVYNTLGNFSLNVFVSDGIDTLPVSFSNLINIGSPPLLSLGNDTTFCNNSSFALSVDDFPGILWSTGQTTNSIIVVAEGSYFVNVIDSFGCSASDTINLIENPMSVFTLADTVYKCMNDTLILTGPANMMTYDWSNGMSTINCLAILQGSYELTFTDSNFCEWKDTSMILDLLQPYYYLPDDTLICSGANILFQISNYASVVWNDSIANTDYLVSLPELITVQLIDPAGCYYDTVMVDTVNCLSVFDQASNVSLNFYPNPFSSYVTLQFSDANADYSIAIYNAGAALVYSHDRITNGTMIDLSNLSKGLYFYNINKGLDKFSGIIEKQ